MKCQDIQSTILTKSDIEEINKSHEGYFIEGLDFNQQRSVTKNIANELYRAGIEGRQLTASQLKESMVTYLDSQIKDKQSVIDTNKLLGLETDNENIQFVLDRLISIRDSVDALIHQSKIYLATLNNSTLYSVEDDSIRDNQDDGEIDDEAGNEALMERTSFQDDFYLGLDSKNTTSARLKKFLAFTKKFEYIGEKLTPVTNIIGRQDYMDFDYVYNELHRILEGVKPSKEDILIKLRTEANKANDSLNNNLAWLENFIDYFNSKEVSEATRREFIVDMTKHKIDMNYVNYNTTKDDNGNTYFQLKVYNDDSGSIVQRSLQTWKVNHVKSYIVQDEVYSKKVKDEMITVLGTVNKLKTDRDKATVIYNILHGLGVKVNELYIDSIYSEGVKVYFGRKNDVADRNNLAEILSFIISKIPDGTDPHEYEFINESLISGLARGNARYTGDEFSNSFRVGDKTIYTYSLNQYLVNRVRDLKDVKSNLVKDLSKSIFTQDSLYLKEMQDINSTLKDWFDIGYVSLNPLKKSKGKRSDNITKLSSLDFEVVKYGFYKRGTKFSELKVGDDTFDVKDATFFFPTTSDKSRIMSINGLAFEATETFKDEKGNRKTKFSNKAINLLYETVVKPELNRIYDTQGPDFKEAVNLSSYKGDMFYLLPTLNNLTVPVKNSNGEIEDISLIEAAKRDPNLNEEQKLVVTKELINILNGLTRDKRSKWKKLGLITEKNWLKHIENSKSSKGTYYTNEQVIGNMIFSYLIANTNMFQLIIGDPSQYFKKDTKGTYSNITKRLAAEIAPGLEMEGKDYLQVFIKEVITESDNIEYLETLLGKEKASAFKKMKAADAQEYTTWKEHLDVLLNLGKITDEEYAEASKAFSEGKLPSKELFTQVLQPIKPVYAYNEVVPIGNRFLDKKTYIKSSSFPLIPALTKGLQIDKLRVAMEKLEKVEGKTVRAAMESAVKVGFPSKVLTLVKDNKGSIVDDIDLTGKYVIQKRAGFRIQQDIPYDELKEFINDGTQQKKLLFTNISDPELEQEYTNTYNQLYALGLQEFYKRIYKPGTEEVNIDKLSELLTEELRKNGETSKPLYDGLKVLDGEFTVPLWLSPYSDKYSALVGSIVKNMIISHKIPGKSYVLGSNVGFKPYTPEDKDYINNKETGIVFTDSYNFEKGLQYTFNDNGTIKYAQVLVPFKFKDDKGKILDIKQFVKNGKLDHTKLPKELLNLFGFRIPTQLHASMSTIEIVGFLPSTSGDLIIAPAEFTVQMGSDFDVDKLYTYMYRTNYSKEQGLTKAPQVRYDGKNLEEYKDGLYNKLLNIHFQVMNKPELQSSINSPLGFGSYPEVISTLNKFDTSELKPLISDQYQEDKFYDGTSGKSGIGMFSSDSIFNALAQNKDLKLVVARETMFEEEIPVRVEFGNQYEVSNGELSKVYTNKIGSTRFKTEVIAAAQNLSVDNANEQGMYVVNMNQNTFSVYSILNFLGFEEDISGPFMSQPIIKEYVEELRNKRSILNEFVPNIENTIIDNLVKRYSQDKYNEEEHNSLADFKGKDASKVMYDLIEKKETYPKYGLYQASILKKFQYLQSIEKPLSSIKQLLNLDSKGFSKSMYINQRRLDVLAGLKNSNIVNAEELFGVYTKEGIVPTTTAGFDNIMGNQTLLNTFGDYFLESKDTLSFKPIVRYMENLTGRELTEKQVLSLRNSYKNYLLSNINLADIDTTRKDLFKRKDKGSLYDRLVSYQNSSFGKVNPFTRLLDVKFDKHLEIDYNNAAGDNFDESNIYKGFVDLFRDGNERNGVIPAQLGEDLILYALLRGGNKAQQFLKFIPSVALSKILNIPSKNSEYKIFIDQYIRHKPTEAILINEGYTEVIEGKILLAKPAPDYIRVQSDKNEFLYKKDVTTENTYNRINTLGATNVEEYVPYNKIYSVFNLNRNSEKLVKINPLSENTVDKEIGNEIEIKKEQVNSDITTMDLDFQSLPHLLNSIANLTNSKYLEEAKLAKVLISNVDPDIILTKDNKIPSRYVDNTKTININPDKKTGRALLVSILHETLHSLTTKYIYNLEQNKEVPSEVKEALLRLNGFKNQLIDNLTQEQKLRFDKFNTDKTIEAYNSGLEKKVNYISTSSLIHPRVRQVTLDTYNKLKNNETIPENNIELSVEEQVLYYSLSNLQEFIAMAGSREANRNLLLKVGGNKYIEDIKNLFKKILEFLGVTESESQKFLNDIFTASSLKDSLEEPNNPTDVPFEDIYISSTELSELEKEGEELERLCLGKSKIKAKKGLRTSNVKPSKWTIVDDLKGLPSHSEGGVDLEINEGRVHFINKSSKIHAKYGLVVKQTVKAEKGLIKKEKSNTFTQGFSWYQTDYKCGGYAKKGAVIPRKIKKSELNSNVWNIVTDLAGQPTHKEGGVDLEIVDGKTHFVKGDKKIYAKCGCLIKATKHMKVKTNNNIKKSKYGR